MSRGLRQLLTLGIVAFFAREAKADNCDYFRQYAVALYKVYCNGGSSGGGGGAKPAGASSTFSSSFNLNSAALPTDRSSYGLETIGSVLRDDWSQKAPTFSIVKGFQKFGAGVSTGSNNTFYGNDVLQRLSDTPNVRSFKPREASRGYVTNLNLGTAFKVGTIAETVRVSLGGSIRYNKVTNTWGGGPAVLFSSWIFSTGAGYSREKISNSMDPVHFVSALASVRLWLFEVQYDFLKEISHPELTPIHIATVSFTFKRLILNGAVRRLNYLSSGWVEQRHGAAQFMFSNHLSGGVLYNYIPGATSVGFQYFL